VLIVGRDAGWGLERELQSWTTGAPVTVACELQSPRYDLMIVVKGKPSNGWRMCGPRWNAPSQPAYGIAGT
jgi:hypothetical protein